MRAVTFRPTHRLVVELIEGDSLLESVDGLLADAEGGAERLELVARGRIDQARLAGDEQARAGLLEVIQLAGSATREGTAFSLLAIDERSALVAGRLLDARAVALELSCELLERVQPAATAPAAAPISWGAVAAASARAQAEALDELVEDEAGAPPPALGDRIDHGTFGLCVVEKIDEDEEFVLVRNPAKRLLRLSLDVLRLELLGEEDDGSRRFRARPRGGKERP